jgi:hypothetical protein
MDLDRKFMGNKIALRGRSSATPAGRCCFPPRACSLRLAEDITE